MRASLRAATRPAHWFPFLRADAGGCVLLAACVAVTSFVTHDALRTALLRERAVLGEAVMRLARGAWDEAEDPCAEWATGAHVSSQAPALAAVLLGDVEGEGAQGGVALSPASVAAVVAGLAAVMGRPSSSGSYIWCGIPSRPRSRARVR